MEKQFITLTFAILLNCVGIAQTVIVNSDGTHSILINNGSTSTIVNPDGTHSIMLNNGNTSTIVNPDGTHSILINNGSTSTIVSPDSTHSTIINNSAVATFANLEADSIKNNGADTIKNVVPANLKTEKKKSE